MVQEKEVYSVWPSSLLLYSWQLRVGLWGYVTFPSSLARPLAGSCLRRFRGLLGMLFCFCILDCCITTLKSGLHSFRLRNFGFYGVVVEWSRKL